MILSYWTLAVALSLSLVAAWYSIIGLTAIFAAAAFPIIVMGGIMEVAKVTVTLWLHEYWQQCKRSMKVQLTFSVVVLMFVTSMGIFGFLSKAHLDQAVPTGDVAAKVQILDEKIKTERDTIESARRALSQLDSAVDQTMARSNDEKGAAQAVQLRRSQARERTNLQNEISQSQKSIAALNTERAPIASELRKVEAEVGPIKYIAALIYGDDPDSNLLEKAVRWVIIILVLVFDPLAIMMVLAATESLKWEKERQDATRRRKIEEDTNNATTDVTNNDIHVDSNTTDDNGGLVEPTAEPTQHDSTTGTGSGADNDNNVAVAEVVYVDQTPAEESTSTDTPVLDASDERPGDYLTAQNTGVIDEDQDDHITRQAKHLWKLDHPTATLKEQRRLHTLGHIDHLPWDDYLDDSRIVRDASFGKTLPATGAKGDKFVLVSQNPTRLYKHNGEKWIEIDKTISDSYAYNVAYIDYLVQRIASGEYDPEFLTDTERQQIENILQEAK